MIKEVKGKYKSTDYKYPNSKQRSNHNEKYDRQT